MRFELRLFVIAMLIFALIAIACHSQAIAGVRCQSGPDCGDNLKFR